VNGVDDRASCDEPKHGAGKSAPSTSMVLTWKRPGATDLQPRCNALIPCQIVEPGSINLVRVSILGSGMSQLQYSARCDSQLSPSIINNDYLCSVVADRGRGNHRLSAIGERIARQERISLAIYECCLHGVAKCIS